MLNIAEDGTIRLTRGDTARFTVAITNETNANEYVMQPGDTLAFTIRKNVNDNEPLLQKVLTGTNTFHIEPKDTATFQFGDYKYDVQLTTAGGDVYTVIAPSIFEIMEEVSY